MQTLKLRVEGMSCGGCETSVRNAVGQVSGVESVTADHEQGRVEVSASSPVDEKAIREAITAAGFTVQD